MSKKKVTKEQRLAKAKKIGDMRPRWHSGVRLKLKKRYPKVYLR